MTTLFKIIISLRSLKGGKGLVFNFRPKNLKHNILIKHWKNEMKDRNTRSKNHNKLTQSKGEQKFGFQV